MSSSCAEPGEERAKNPATIIAEVLREHRLRVYTDAIRSAPNYDPKQHEPMVTQVLEMSSRDWPQDDDMTTAAEILAELRAKGIVRPDPENEDQR